MDPLVTIICISYNHVSFVREAMESVFNQSYRNIQVIAADDCSSDGTAAVLEDLVKEREEVILLKSDCNRGNCVTFNDALTHAKGKYVVDFSTDDVLLPDFLEKQVQVLESMPEEVGLVFSDAYLINEAGKILRTHYRRDQSGAILQTVPEGDVYKDVVARYFINPPTAMIRKSVLEELGGYDESLAFEDFDLWVRCSRKYQFAFNDAVLVKKRKHQENLSSNMYKHRFQESIYRICLKAAWMNKDEEENEALAVRVRYEMKQAYFSAAYHLVNKYYKLLIDLGKVNRLAKLWRVMALLKINVSPLRKLYRRYRFI